MNDTIEAGILPAEAPKEKMLYNNPGKRCFFVIERSEMFFKGYDLLSGKVEFTDDIMQARWFTHTRAARPRVGERILQLNLNIKEDSITLLA